MHPNTENSLKNIFGIPTEQSLQFPTELVVARPVESTDMVPAQTQEVVLTQAEIEAEEDYQFSRGALKSLAADAQSTFHRASDVAQQVDNPRAYEAAAIMLKAAVEVHRELRELQKSSAEVKLAKQAASAPTQAPVNIEKGVVITATGEELLRMIQKDRN